MPYASFGPMLGPGTRPSRGEPEGEVVHASPPAGFDEIQRHELSRLFGRMVGVRLVVFVPLALMLALFVALAEPARWRSRFLVALLVPIATFFIVEAVRVRRGAGFRERAVFWNLLAAMLAQVGVAFATGDSTLGGLRLVHGCDDAEPRAGALDLPVEPPPERWCVRRSGAEHGAFRRRAIAWRCAPMALCASRATTRVS